LWFVARLLFGFFFHVLCVQMETYSGWFDVEGKPHRTLSGETFVPHMRKILETRNASISIYMAYGGTNYGFSNGGDPPIEIGPIEFTRYHPDVTSYDYDAPIHEAGQYHDTKFALLRDLLVPLTGRNITAPAEPPIASYGAIAMNQWAPLQSAVSLFPNVVTTEPLGMEQLRQGFGYVAYRTLLAAGSSAGTLSVEGTLQDRATVLVDWQQVCVWDPWSKRTCELPAGRDLVVLVENKGRPSGQLEDFSFARKGLYGSFVLDGKVLQNWTMVSLAFNSSLPALPYTSVPPSHASTPAIYSGTFRISGTPQQTFFLLPSWGRGIVSTYVGEIAISNLSKVLVNGFNIGRFTDLGPQCSLFVPQSALLAVNEIVMFESDSAFVNAPRNIISSSRQIWFNSSNACPY
jgi:hypothetical protein